VEFTQNVEIEVNAMSTPIEANVGPSVASARSAKSAKSAKSIKKSYLLFFSSWFFLIASGVLGTMLYTEHLKTQLSSHLANQTEAQLQTMQTQYQQQLDQLKASVTTDISALQAKVDSFNELLAFTKDSANSKTDNSNQLYSQLAEVKKKLDELKANLDVLK
jgi:peptidoglycan hydrolase CwlO-like protein